MRTQSTKIVRLTRADAVKDAEALQRDFNERNKNHGCKVTPHARIIGLHYMGYIKIAAEV